MNQRYKPRRNDEDLLDLLGKPEPFQVMAQPLATAFTVNVNETFENVKQFENIVQILDNARQGDVLEIKLSTNGGALHAIIPLLAAMASTQAQVYVHAVSDVASAGTFLLMAADDVFINPYSTIMFHQVSFGSGGTGSSVEAHVSHTMKSSKQLIRDMYQDFFSEEEVDAMLAGRDFYMGKEEFDARYNARAEKREATLEEAVKQAQAALQAKPKKARKKKEIVEQTEA